MLRRLDQLVASAQHVELLSARLRPDPGSARRAVLDAPAATLDAPISDAEMADLTTIAEQQGMTLERAIERYAWNDNVALAVDQIRQQSPEAFAGAQIVDEDTVWLAFAEDPSPGR